MGTDKSVVEEKGVEDKFNVSMADLLRRKNGNIMCTNDFTDLIALYCCLCHKDWSGDKRLHFTLACPNNIVETVQKRTGKEENKLVIKGFSVPRAKRFIDMVKVYFSHTMRDHCPMCRGTEEDRTGLDVLLTKTRSMCRLKMPQYHSFLDIEGLSSSCIASRTCCLLYFLKFHNLESVLNTNVPKGQVVEFDTKSVVHVSMTIPPMLPA